MVLLQDDSSQVKHLIYYLSKGLFDPELHYSHVKKLSLEMVHALQHVKHYHSSLKNYHLSILQPNATHIEPSYHWGKVLEVDSYLIRVLPGVHFFQV